MLPETSQSPIRLSVCSSSRRQKRLKTTCQTMSGDIRDDAEQAEVPEELIALAQSLLAASRVGTAEAIAELLKHGAPAWYQDEALGWSALHYAAERRNPRLLEVLIGGGAVWNAVDKWGRTAGEICLSLGDREGWEIIRNEGIRSGTLSFSRLDP